MANGEDLSLDTLLEYAYGFNPSQTNIEFREDLAVELEGLTSTPTTRTFEDYDMSDSSITMSGPDYIAAVPEIDGTVGNVSITGNNGSFVEPINGRTTQTLSFGKQAVENMKFGNGFVTVDNNFDWDTNSLDHTASGFGSPISVASYFFRLKPREGEMSRDDLVVEYSDEYGVKSSSPIEVSKEILFANIGMGANSNLIELNPGGNGGLGGGTGFKDVEITVNVSVSFNFEDLVESSPLDNITVTAIVNNTNPNSFPAPPLNTVTGSISSSGESISSTFQTGIPENEQPIYNEITSFSFSAPIDSNAGGGTIEFTG
jgi:hypothetical protein